MKNRDEEISKGNGNEKGIGKENVIDDTIKNLVKSKYGKIARDEKYSCCSPSCCGTSTPLEGISDIVKKYSKDMGYSKEDLDSIPQKAILGLGCGNPVAIASLKEGETVLDLGSGAGIDCFLASKKVGKNGRVIGVDMTPEMVERANKNAKESNIDNVEFRYGEIENLPVTDDSVDVIISNCVINLSPDKDRVFKEAMRVLKPGGRMIVSDIVTLRELPEVIRKSIDLYVGCVSGALLKDEYIEKIRNAGFERIEVIGEALFSPELLLNDPVINQIAREEALGLKELKDIVKSVISIKIQAYKPE